MLNNCNTDFFMQHRIIIIFSKEVTASSNFKYDYVSKLSEEIIRKFFICLSDSADFTFFENISHCAKLIFDSFWMKNSFWKVFLTIN